MATMDPLPLEEVTHAAFNGVLRALEARKVELRHFPGPIIVGLVAWPELQQGQIQPGQIQPGQIQTFE